MKTRYLFPHGFKKLGWIILIPSLIIGLLWFFEILKFAPINVQVLAINNLGSDKGPYILNDIIDEVFGVLIIVGGLLTAFSKEETEDECIAKIRLESLLWATYINYSLLLLSILFIYDLEFLQVLVFNMFTLLVIFLIRFNFILIKSRQEARNEK